MSRAYSSLLRGDVSPRIPFEHLADDRRGRLVGHDDLVPLTQWRGKSFIGGGRKRVRNSLFVGAMVAARYNPQLKSFRDKLVAVARKLITILNAILRDRRSWQQIPA